MTIEGEVADNGSDIRGKKLEERKKITKTKKKKANRLKKKGGGEETYTII